MSLCRIALRIAAVEAIKGRTLVEDRVLDSPNGALDVQADGRLRTAEEKPFVSIFTDQGKAEGVTGRSLIENGLCELVIEMGVSGAMVDLNPDTGETTLVGISVPATDSSIEFKLDIIQRQVFDALTDPDNEWAEIYRGLHYGVEKIDYVGARNNDDGQKLAGRQVRITVAMADDPVQGEALESDTPFLKFLTKLEASDDPDYQQYAAVMQAVLEGSDEPWKSLQRRHGMTASELHALGRGPLADDEDRSTPVFDEARLEVDDRPSVTVEVDDV